MLLWLWLLGLAAFVHAQDITTTTPAPCPYPRNKERREHGVEDIPYIVYLEYENRADPTQSPMNGCGIIIERNAVLTLARICESASKKSLKVYAGMTYAGEKTSPMYVAEYIIHPDRGRRPFDETNVYTHPEELRMNFCLLRMSSPFMFGPGVQKAALPDKKEALDRTTPHMVSGWGPYKDVNFIQGRCSNALNKNYTRASLFFNRPFISPQQECLSDMTKSRMAATDDVFCLGYRCKNFRTNYGDEGGPVVNIKTQKVVGMVINCAACNTDHTMDQPNADLSFAVDWINEKRVEWAKYLVELDFTEVTQGIGMGMTGEGEEPTGVPPQEGPPPEGQS